MKMWQLDRCLSPGEDKTAAEGRRQILFSQGGKRRVSISARSRLAETGLHGGRALAIIIHQDEPQR